MEPSEQETDPEREAAGPSDGVRLFELINGQPSWIHRRIDRTNVEPDGETRRLRSFDLTVPRRLAIRRDGGLVVPLALLSKRPLVRLDTLGPDGRPLPVLARAENGDVVHQMLVEAFGRVVNGPLSPTMIETLRSAVMENDPDGMHGRVEELSRAITACEVSDTAERDTVLALASDLVHQFLFAVIVPSEYAGVRIVVKVSVTEDITGVFPDWAVARDGRSMDLPLTLGDSAASAHFEFRAPMGLQVASVRLLTAHDEELRLPGPAVTRGSTAHLTGLERSDLLGDSPVRARVELEPVADGFLRQTALATLFVAVLLLVGAVKSEQVSGALAANRGGAVAASALAIPALFLSLQSRRPEHAWVARTLFVPRLINVFTAATLYCLAVYLVVVRADSASVHTVMWAFFAVQVVPTAIASALLRQVSVGPATVTDTE